MQIMKNKSECVLVTGGAGYIGSHIAKALLDKNFQVVVYDNLSTGHLEAIDKRATFVNADIRDAEKLKEIISKYNIAGIIHFAAKIVVPESVSMPEDYYENNTYGVMKLVEAAKTNHKIKIVFSSTAAVYGDLYLRPIEETDAVAPSNPYATSKVFSEQILRDADVAYGLKTIILRYFNVAGASSDQSIGQKSKNSTHLIKLAAEVACGKRKNLHIFGTDYKTKDGTGVRDYIHVEDLADIHVLALESLLKGAPSNLYNCGYGVGFSVREVIEAMEEACGHKMIVYEDARRPGDVDSLIGNNAKIKKDLGWIPSRNSLVKICKSALEWENKLP